jgi:hypothetical protein
MAPIAAIDFTPALDALGVSAFLAPGLLHRFVGQQIPEAA